LIIKNKPYSGFKKIEDIKALIPELNIASTTGATKNAKTK
jgi:hypothetical protein